MFGLFRNRESPRFRLGRSKLTTFWDLDAGEFLMVGVLWFILPLLMFGTRLPEPAKYLGIGSFALWGAFLFFFKVDHYNMAYWVAKTIPFWLRQRRFKVSASRAPVTPDVERIDALLAYGPNSLSFVRTVGDDGIVEYHIYEQPLRPYRALVVGMANLPVHAPGSPGGVRTWL